ncbi:MAG TPA: O-antigen ligase family protein [Streptosporangiaceae bacterium]|nr:O-antigen ligase family protein [Streptosporangiaceae bacterium]
MTDNRRGPVALLTRSRPEAGTRPRRTDVVMLLTCYLFLLMAIPSSLVVGPLGGAGAPAGLFAAVLLCWYMVAWQHPLLPLDRGKQPVRVVAALFGCATVAAYVSANRVAQPVLTENGADRGLITLAGWLGVLLLAADGIERPDGLTTLFRRIVMGSTAMALLGIVEFFSGLNLASYIVIPGLSVHTQPGSLSVVEGLNRATATTSQPLELAAVLAISLPLAIHQAIFAAEAVRLRRWLQVAVIAVAMLMTVSRSAILGLAVIAIVLLPTWPKSYRHHAYRALLAALVAGWLVEPKVLSSFGQLIGNIGTDTSISSRTQAYSSAVPYIAGHPWFGLGFQTFFPQTYFFVDNQYLTSLIETGFVGALSVLALFVTGWFVARSARRAACDTRTRDLMQCLAASVAAAAVSFSTFDALGFVIAPGLTFLMLGCVGAAWRLVRAQRQSAS